MPILNKAASAITGRSKQIETQTLQSLAHSLPDDTAIVLTNNGIVGRLGSQHFSFSPQPLELEADLEAFARLMKCRLHIGSK